MSHYIPVFFAPIEKDKLPEKPETWNSVEHVLVDLWKRRGESGLRLTTSRNWWHQHALSLISTGLKIGGLEFIQSEVVCLETKGLVAALRALDEVLARIRDGIPDLGPENEEHGSIWGLRHYYNGNDTQAFSKGLLRRAFEDSEVVAESKSDHDIGYDSVVAFYCFVRSLRATVIECLSAEKCLLYVQPQP
jgi:hypothetical protein